MEAQVNLEIRIWGYHDLHMYVIAMSCVYVRLSARSSERAIEARAVERRSERAFVRLSDPATDLAGETVSNF